MPNTHPRLVIAGTHSGAGKTSVVTAALAALRARGVPLRPFKVGPDYIDPAFHAHVTGTPSRNLDSWLLDAPVLRGLFARAANGGLSLIEGVMGLFDGKGSGHEGSTAHVAEILDAPVVLVISAQGLSRSAAAMVAGYASFHPRVRVGGVIVNRVKSARQYGLIRDSVEKACAVPCLGYLPENPDFALQSRHLGLVPSQEVAELDAVVAHLALAAGETIDLDGLMALADGAPPLPAGELPRVEGSFPVRIGVARDSAFSFYYQDNFDLLQTLGAELVFFSPMRDRSLPDALHGLYLGGGFPEVFAQALAANGPMRSAIREAVSGGLPVYAECGGMAYLCVSLADAAGTVFPMAGVFPHRAVMTGKLQRFGYAEAEFCRETVLGPAGTRVRTHEFHYSRIEPEDGTEGCYRMRKDGVTPWRGGLASGNVLAAYPHIHFYSNPSLPRNFLARCGAFKAGRP
ncbi:Cobyrinic acid A,C-diamide synthase [uncultured delta proteobacterium]|uniref:Cobyrinate a,c-diamide synthase n=1 Tax=uncultured delta proteobacterium TaxID=34034 RepID=A0A212JHE1_9DELT|nr:Cobyrinic acid A,C-diamide synthase [uncultured delta proteobacterium]